MHSDHIWPDSLGDEKVRHARGVALGMPFPYWIMRNVNAAIQSLSAGTIGTAPRRKSGASRASTKTPAVELAL
jgi:hypothetical protein